MSFGALDAGLVERHCLQQCVTLLIPVQHTTYAAPAVTAVIYRCHQLNSQRMQSQAALRTIAEN